MGHASTINMEGLLLQIEEFGFFEPIERQIIMTFPDSQSQLDLIYRSAKLKGINKFYEVLDCLKYNGYYAAASALEELERKSNYTDFPVQEEHLNRIIDVLEGIPITPLQWHGVLKRLITSFKRRIELDNLLLSQPLRETMYETLNNWRTSTSKDSAMFSVLVEIMEERNKQASDELIKQRDSIFNLE